ncbi:MAG: uroporphyrinogen-III synthase [Xanthobacteraceae bacterium]
MRLLVTRPEPDCARTAALLRERGHDVIAAPLLRIEPIADADFGQGPFGGVVITSANAARWLASHPRRHEVIGLPVFAVGKRSAEAARAAGFSAVISADQDVRALGPLITQHQRADAAPLLYVAALDRSGDLAGDLAALGIVVKTTVAYRAVKAEALPDVARQALTAGALEGVLHLSRRSAEAYLDCCRNAGLLRQGLAPMHYCLSSQVAEPLVSAGAVHTRIAARPEETALLDLLAVREGSF